MPSDADTKAAAASAKGKAGVDNRKQWFAFEHNITLQYPNGQPAAPLAQVTRESATTSGQGT